MTAATASSNDSTVTQPRSRGLHIALWVAQVLLAGLFALSGFMKSTLPVDQLATKIPWSPTVPLQLVRFIGVSELAGALGLILPAATRMMPRLTPIAASALALVMVLATGFHVSRGEFQALPLTLGLGCVAAFIAWGRFMKAPIPPRG